jgi:hypothetical protein
MTSGDPDDDRREGTLFVLVLLVGLALFAWLVK